MNEFGLIDTSEVPPPDPAPGRILRLRAAQVIDCVILGKTWGVNTHWTGHESQPHFRAEGKCPGCKRRDPMKWKGYWYVLPLGKNPRCGWLEVTPTIVESIQLQAGTKGDLRGLRVMIARGNGDRSHTKSTVQPPCEVRGALPNDEDPYRLLLKLWGYDPNQKELFFG
jgi:hypothetical protein